MYHTFLHGKNKQNLVSSPLQEKLREAAKARLRRMMRNHATKKGLNVPDWAKEQYKVRGQDEMAKMLMDANWSKDWCIYIYMSLYVLRVNFMFLYSIA